MAMTPLPTAPSRATPTTFATLADAFVTALPQFVTEANALQTDVTTKQGTASSAATTATTQAGNASTSATNASTSATNAATSATAAQTSANSAANAPGTSATSTTSNAVNLGSVTFAIQTGKLFSVGQTVVIASTATPTTQMVGVITASDNAGGSLTVNVTTLNGSGTYAAWTISMSGPQGSSASVNGGATRVSSATSITLTAGSTRLQAVTMTATGQSVTLPDATTLPLGGSLYVIKNEGTNTFAVRDGAGVAIAVIAAGQIGAFYLITNSIAAGSWAVGNQSTVSATFADIFTNVTTALNSTATTYISISQLTATTLICSAVIALQPVAFVISISGNALSIGSSVVVQTVSSSTAYDTYVVALSATKAVVAYAIYTTGYTYYTTVITISGTTITVGGTISPSSQMGWTSSGSSVIKIVALTSTTALISYVTASPSGGGNYVAVLSSPATTPSLGTGVQVASGITTYRAPTPIFFSATSVLTITAAPSSGTYTFQFVAISGTTVTLAGSAYVLVPNIGGAITDNTYYESFTLLSATSAVLLFSFSGGTYGSLVAQALTISGTSITSVGGINVGQFQLVGYGTTATPTTSIAIQSASAIAVTTTKILVSYAISGVGYAMHINLVGGKWVAGTSYNMGSVQGTYPISFYQLAPNKNVASYSGTGSYFTDTVYESIP